MKKVGFCLSALLSVGLSPGWAGAQAHAAPLKTGAFHKFDVHIQHLKQTTFKDYRALPGVKVTSAAAFDKMKDYILSLYRNVKVTHTFLGHGGNFIDCIAIDKQPGALAEVKRGHKLQLTPPNLHTMPKLGAGKKLPATAKGMPPQLQKGMKDKFGNEMYCPVGSIPMRRVRSPGGTPTATPTPTSM